MNASTTRISGTLAGNRIAKAPFWLRDLIAAMPIVILVKALRSARGR